MSGDISFYKNLLDIKNDQLNFHLTKDTKYDPLLDQWYRITGGLCRTWQPNMIRRFLFFSSRKYLITVSKETNAIFSHIAHTILF